MSGLSQRTYNLARIDRKLQPLEQETLPCGLLTNKHCKVSKLNSSVLDLGKISNIKNSHKIAASTIIENKLHSKE